MPTDKALRAAASRYKPYKITDSQGLFLHVSTSGHKSWRLKCRIHGKEQLMTFGSYPEASLLVARERRYAARKDLREGCNSRHAEKRAKLVRKDNSVMTFETVARRWHGINVSR